MHSNKTKSNNYLSKIYMGIFTEPNCKHNKAWNICSTCKHGKITITHIEDMKDTKLKEDWVETFKKIINQPYCEEAEDFISNLIKEKEEQAYISGLEANYAKTYKSSESYTRGFEDGMSKAMETLKDVISNN